MSKKNSSNNEFLNSAKKVSSHKIYAIIYKLVNDGREDLAESVIKIDYLLENASGFIKDKDYKEAEEILKRAEDRMDILEDNNIDIDYLRYLSEGIKKKIK